ncbi:MAG: hypothetical protein ACI8XC_000172 [Gammaproteobacteria bacterium]|jgi:hypothetical protein
MIVFFTAGHSYVEFYSFVKSEMLKAVADMPKQCIEQVSCPDAIKRWVNQGHESAVLRKKTYYTTRKIQIRAILKLADIDIFYKIRIYRLTKIFFTTHHDG